jgi:hypothetical protein
MLADTELDDHVTLGDDVRLEPTSRVRVPARSTKEVPGPLDAGLRPWRERMVHHVRRAEVVQSAEISVPVPEIIELLHHGLVVVTVHHTRDYHDASPATSQIAGWRPGPEPCDVVSVPQPDGERVVPKEDLTTEDRSALGWAVSTEHSLGTAVVERVRSGGSGITAGELAVIRREWEREGRPAPERHVHRSVVVFDDGTTVTAVTFFADDPYSREVLPSFGLYLDKRWAPSWAHSHLDWPDFGVPTDRDALRVALLDLL